MKSYTHLLVVLFCMVFTSVKAQFNFEEPDGYVSIQNSCVEHLGAIYINENNIPYTYFYWSDTYEFGDRTNLVPGEYTLVLMDEFYNCTEVTYWIVDLDKCKIEPEITPLNQCLIHMYIAVISEGVYLHPNSYEVHWTDDNYFGHSRVLTIGPGQDNWNINVLFHHYTQCCSSISENITVEYNPNCGRDTELGNNNDNHFIVNEGPSILINEINLSEFEKIFTWKKRILSEEVSYIELLVIGDGSCLSYHDLTSYQLCLSDTKSSDSTLAPAMKLHKFPYNKGLSFSDHSIWKRVPNGSIIIIFNGESDDKYKTKEIKLTYQDNRNIYFVSANNPEYFHGLVHSTLNITTSKSSSQSSTKFPVKKPQWADVKIGVKYNAIGVYKDENLIHGISINNVESQLKFQDPNLIKTDIAIDKKRFSGNISLINTKWSSPNSYLLNQNATPGKFNSEENRFITDDFKKCLFEKMTINRFNENASVPISEPKNNNFYVYPNPAHSELFMTAESKVTGPGKIIIYSALGRVVHMQNISFHSSQQLNDKILLSNFNTGMYFIEIKFPDNSVSVLKFTVIH